ncbi:MAG: VCBS repeat-containing protein, partial [Planctomycetes bacterium]|nr:VCBS repeat-containing protein [Planctomycetota bacterium]
MRSRPARVLPALAFLFVAGSIHPDAVADPPWFSPWGKTAPSTNSAASFWTTADLDGNGRLDVIGGKENELFVGYGDGRGQFGLSAVPLSVTPQFIGTPIVGRFDGDVHLDVVMFDFQATKGLTLLGNGSGGFNVGMPTGVMSNLIEGTAVDVDADGRDELLYGTFGSNPALAKLTASGWSILTSFSPGTGTTRALATGDFDGDGKVDLFAATDGGSTVGGALRVLLGTGAGTFANGPISTLNTSIGTGSSVRTGDIDSDGDLDVALRVGTQLRVARNNGSGAFVLDPTLHGQTTQFAVGDVDSDDDDDLVIISMGRLHARLNNGSGTFAAVGVAYAVPENVRRLDLVRVDGDEALDLILFTSDGQVAFARGNGDGTWGLPRWIAAPQTAEDRAVGVGDLDGDGDGDGVSTSIGSLISSFADGAGTFVQGPNVTVIANNKIEVVDLDQDGLNDCVLGGKLGDTSGPLGIQVVRNVHGVLGTPITKYATNLVVDAPGVDFTTGDFDGDADIDAFVTAKQWPNGLPGPNGTGLCGLVNQGGQLTPSTTPQPAWPLLALSLEHVRTADADNDGDLDLFVGRRQPSSPNDDVVLLFGNGQGAFTQGPIVPLDVWPTSRSLHVLDIDGDGFVDALADDGALGIKACFGTGGGQFTSPALVMLPGKSRDVRFADFDDDGRADAAAIVAGGARIFSQNVSRTFAPVGEVPAGANLADLAP